MSLLPRLIEHQWKETIRSPEFGRDLAGRGLTLAVALVFSVNLLVVGLNLDVLLSDFAENERVGVFNQWLLFSYLVLFLVRLFLESFPAQRFRPYLHLPVPRRGLVHWLLIRSLVSVYNLVPLFLLIPFTVEVLGRIEPTAASAAWFVYSWLLLAASGLLAMALKYGPLGEGGRLPVVILSLVLLLLLTLIGWLPLVGLSGTLFNFPLGHPWIAVLAAAGLMALTYRLAFHGLWTQLQVDESTSFWSGGQVGRELPGDWIPRFPFKPDRWMSLEIRMMLRNRRPRSALWTAFLVPALGLLIYPSHQGLPAEGSALGMDAERLDRLFLIYLGTVLSGAPMVTYGQFILGWESGYLEGLHSRPVNWSAYLRTRHWVLMLLALGGYLICLPFSWFGWHVFWVNSSLLLFHSGVSSALLLMLATFSRKRLDLGEGMWSSQGRGTARTVTSLIVLAAPAAAAIPALWLAGSQAALLWLGALGLIGVATAGIWLGGVKTLFLRQRHRILEGFRQG